MDSEDLIMFTLRACNPAGLCSIFNTGASAIPSQIAPAEGTVKDINPDAYDLEDTSPDDFSYQTNMTTVCTYVSGFSHHREAVNMSISVGTTIGGHDILNNIRVTKPGYFCNTLALQHMVKYYTTAKATSNGGVTTVTSDGITVINKAHTASQLHAMDGHGCADMTAIPINLNVQPSNGSDQQLRVNFNVTRGLWYTLTFSEISDNFDVQLIKHSYKQFTLNGTVKMLSFLGLHDTVYLKIMDKNGNPGNFTDINSRMTLKECLYDKDMQGQDKELEAHILMPQEIKRHVSHIRCAAVYSQRCNSSNCQDLSYITAYTDYHSSTKCRIYPVALETGAVYKTAVQVCFKHLCMDTKYTTGVKILAGEDQVVIDKAQAVFYGDTNELHLQLLWEKAHIAEIAASGYQILYEWSLSRSPDGSHTVIPWQHDYVSTNDDAAISVSDVDGLFKLINVIVK